MMLSDNPARLDAPIPQRREIPDFVLKRKDRQNGASGLVKEVEAFALAEETYPSDVYQELYAELVGLKDIKDKTITALRSIFCPDFVRAWAQQYNCERQAFNLLRKRYPVLLFHGEPGVGKSELALAIGDPLARVLGTPVVSYQIGLQLRGGGLVGQLTQNIAKLMAFAHLRHAELGCPVLLVLDEGDAIAQSRDGDDPQHHEDISGVSAILQQIDHMRRNPGVALIMTTNRLSALDRALLSRGGAQRVHFPLPDYGMRYSLLLRHLEGIIITGELRTLARSTEGFSHRDLDELCQAAFLEAQSTYSPVTMRHLLRGVAAIDKMLLNGCQGGSQALICLPNDHPIYPPDVWVQRNGYTANQALA